MYTVARLFAEFTEVPANVSDRYNEAKSSIGVKQGAPEIGMEPASKHMQVEIPEETDVGTQEETQMGAWMEHKMTKASDWLELVSLQGLIV